MEVKEEIREAKGDGGREQRGPTIDGSWRSALERSPIARG